MSESDIMKVLVLGAGKKDNIYLSRCHACLSDSEYKYCIENAQTLVTLDCDSAVVPDVVSDANANAWGEHVRSFYGNDFDVVIDAIGSGATSAHCLVQAALILVEDGVVYGRDTDGVSKKTWFNREGAMLG